MGLGTLDLGSPLVPCRHDLGHRMGDLVCPARPQATPNPKQVKRPAHLVVGALRVGMAVPLVVRQPRLGTSARLHPSDPADVGILLACRASSGPHRQMGLPKCRVGHGRCPRLGCMARGAGRSACGQGLDAMDVTHPTRHVGRPRMGLGCATSIQDQHCPLWRPLGPSSQRSRAPSRTPCCGPWP